MDQKKPRKKYSELSDEQKRKSIEAATRYNREVAARTTIKMSKDLDAAMIEYMQSHGFKSKNSFIIELIKREIGWNKNWKIK